MTGFISVHIMVPSKELADKIARALVDDKLAACVNIIPNIRSIYRWQGKVSADHETLLLAKSRADLFAALEAKVKSLHSHNVPCIVAEPIVAGHQPYLDWITTETKT